MSQKSGTRGLYDSPEWRALREVILARDPWCTGPCRGHNPTRFIDHIVPVKDGGARLDPANCQGLCGPCHRLKSRKEQGARGELAGGQDVRQIRPLVAGCDPATGLPLDPAHWWNR